MNDQFEKDTATCERLAHIEERVRRRLILLVRDFQLDIRDNGLVLHGQARSYYAKQLAQQAVMEAAELPIRANEIEVCRG